MQLAATLRKMPTAGTPSRSSAERSVERSSAEMLDSALVLPSELLGSEELLASAPFFGFSFFFFPLLFFFVSFALFCSFLWKFFSCRRKNCFQWALCVSGSQLNCASSFVTGVEGRAVYPR